MRNSIYSTRAADEGKIKFSIVVPFHNEEDSVAALYEKSAVTYARQEEQIYDSYAPILDRALDGLEHRKAFIEIGGGRGFMLRYGHEHGFASQIEVEPSADAEKGFVPASANAQGRKPVRPVCRGAGCRTGRPRR